MIKLLHPDANPYWKKRNTAPSDIPSNNKIIPWLPESKKLSRPKNRPANVSKVKIPILFILNIVIVYHNFLLKINFINQSYPSVYQGLTDLMSPVVVMDLLSTPPLNHHIV